MLAETCQIRVANENALGEPEETPSIRPSFMMSDQRALQTEGAGGSGGGKRKRMEEEEEEEEEDEDEDEDEGKKRRKFGK